MAYTNHRQAIIDMEEYEELMDLKEKFEQYKKEVFSEGEDLCDEYKQKIKDFQKMVRNNDVYKIREQRYCEGSDFTIISGTSKLREIRKATNEIQKKQDELSERQTQLTKDIKVSNKLWEKEQEKQLATLMERKTKLERMNIWDRIFYK